MLRRSSWSRFIVVSAISLPCGGHHQPGRVSTTRRAWSRHRQGTLNRRKLDGTTPNQRLARPYDYQQVLRGLGASIPDSKGFGAWPEGSGLRWRPLPIHPANRMDVYFRSRTSLAGCCIAISTITPPPTQRGGRRRRRIDDDHRCQLVTAGRHRRGWVFSTRTVGESGMGWLLYRPGEGSRSGGGCGNL